MSKSYDDESYHTVTKAVHLFKYAYPQRKLENLTLEELAGFI